MAASGAAMAQSNVTLYGIVDLWVGSVENGLNAKSTTVLESGGVNGSRWGLKGSEDLGGGLKAVFKIESGFKADTGVGNGGPNRQSYVGLEGGFGTVTFGNVWTAMDDIVGASNSGFDSALSASNDVLAVNANYSANPGNSFKYVSPSFGGFSGGFTYSLDETAGVSQDIADFSVSYGAGPIAVNFAYQVQNDTTDKKYTALNGSYDFGVAKLLASYGQEKIGAAKTNDYQIGVDVPLSAALTLSAGYAASDDNAAAGDLERKGYGIAVGYSLSKRTTAYAGFRSNKEETAGGTKVDEGRVIAAGIRHTF
jgi:predicted porin